MNIFPVVSPQTPLGPLGLQLGHKGEHRVRVLPAEREEASIQPAAWTSVHAASNVVDA